MCSWYVISSLLPRECYRIWPVYAATLFRPSPLNEDLLPAVPNSRTGKPGAADELLSRLGDAAAGERAGLLVSYIQALLQSVLRLPSPPSPSVKFFDLGMDSLMAVEIRNRLNQALASWYVVPNTVVFDYPDAGSLGRHLAGKIEESPAAAAQNDGAEAAERGGG